MHVILVIGGGLVLFCLFMLFGKLWGGHQPNLSLAAIAFIPTWLVIAIVNMWVGVTKAGYSVREEWPILILVFAIPAAVAGIALWRLGR